VINPALSIVGLLPTPQLRTAGLLAVLRTEVTNVQSLSSSSLKSRGTDMTGTMTPSCAEHWAAHPYRRSSWKKSSMTCNSPERATSS
jgi:hypothetical protein